MDRPRRGIAAELVAVTLMAGCLAGALAVVIAVHSRQASRRPRPAPAVIAATVPVVAAKPEPAPAPPPAKPLPPRVDPTPRMVAELAEAEAEQRAEADRAFARIAQLDAATRAAKAESDRWKRSVAVARTQIDTRDSEAREIEGKAEMSAFERDALARRRDALKQAIERDRERPSYAVLPHRGPNGTWQRPIVLECDDGGVHVRPNGPSFDLADIASVFGLRGNAFTVAITREALRIQRQEASDGGDVIPYIFFIVRPGGIRAYYEARTRLERLGIAFGYELADSEWKIDFPDLDKPETWDGSPPAHPEAVATIDPTTPRGAGSRPSQAEIDRAFVWPKSPPGSEGREDTAGAVALPGSRRSTGSGGSFARADAEPSSVGGSGTSRAPTFSRGGLGTGGSDGEPVQGDWADNWDKALRRGGPGRLAGRVPWNRGGPGLMGGPDSTPITIDPALGMPRGAQTAWEAAASGAPLPAEYGLPNSSADTNRSANSRDTDTSPDGGSMPRQVAATIPPLPSPNPGDSSQSGANLARGRGDVGEGTGRGERDSGDGQSRGGANSGAGRSGNRGAEGRAGEPGGDGGTPSPLGSIGAAARPFELVLGCGPKGVTVQPGDYRVTKATLNSKDALLAAQLRAIVREEQRTTPGRALAPTVRYLIQPGGQETYRIARSQLDFSGQDWPSSVGFSGGDTPRLFSTDDW